MSIILIMLAIITAIAIKTDWERTDEASRRLRAEYGYKYPHFMKNLKE